MTSQITPLVFTDEIAPIGRVTINNTEYEVVAPDMLEERYYINYYSARAEIMDIVSRYAEDDSMSKPVRMDAEIVPYARRTIEALLQQPADSIKMLPKTVTAVYNAIEGMLNEHYEQQKAEAGEETNPDVPHPSQQGDEPEEASKKNSSSNT